MNSIGSNMDNMDISNLGFEGVVRTATGEFTKAYIDFMTSLFGYEATLMQVVADYAERAQAGITNNKEEPGEVQQPQSEINEGLKQHTQSSAAAVSRPIYVVEDKRHDSDISLSDFEGSSGNLFATYMANSVVMHIERLALNYPDARESEARTSEMAIEAPVRNNRALACRSRKHMKRPGPRAVVALCRKRSISKVD